MSKIIFILFFLFAFFANFSFFNTSSAQTATPSQTTEIEIGAPFPGEKKTVGLVEHVKEIHKWASIIGSLLAIFMIIFAGSKYMMSAGNPEALTDAKETLIGALIGLSIIILSYILLVAVGAKIAPAPQEKPLPPEQLFPK